MRIKVNEGEIIKFDPRPAWEGDFDHLFWLHRVPRHTKQFKDIKAFIQSTLDKQCKELLEKIRLQEPANYCYGDPYFDGYSRAVSDLEALKKSL